MDKLNSLMLAFAVLFVVVFQFFCVYISPYTSDTPTRTKRLLAIVWIVMRRVVCSFGIILFSFAIYYVWHAPKELNIYQQVLLSFIFLVFIFVTTWVGAIGRVSRWSTPAEDISHYKKVKEKFKLR